MAHPPHDCGALWRPDPDPPRRRAAGVPPAAREVARLWRPSDLPGVEVLHASYTTHAFARHTHDEVAVGVIDAGVERFEYRGATHDAPPGSVVVFNAGEVHTGRAATGAGWAMRMLYLDPRLLQDAARALSGRAHDVPVFVAPVIADPELARLLDRLHGALGTPRHTLERETRLLRVLGHLVQAHAEDPPPGRQRPAASRAVHTARAFLDAHAARNVSLRELAEAAGLSPYHLARTFRAELGVTPHAYLEQVRIGRARELLCGRLPLSRVGLEAGFSDQSHFTKRFKRFVGVTPRQYRLGVGPQVSTRAVRRL